MALSPRLLRPIASRSLVDADATAYLAAVQTADGEALEPAVRNAITAFVIGCKADGTWSAIKNSCILMGARTLSGALTPLAGDAPTNVNFVSGDYNRKTGLLGNGTTKAINTNRSEQNYGQNNNHFSVYCSQLGSGFFIANVSEALSSTPSSSLSAAANRNRSTTISSYAAVVGFIGNSRSSSTEYLVRNNSSDNAIARGSSTNSEFNFFVMAIRSPQGSDVTGTHRVAFYSLGDALTLSLLDSRVSTLYTAIGAAIP